MTWMDYSKPKPNVFWAIVSALGLGLAIMHGMIWRALFPVYGKIDVAKNITDTMPYVVGIIIFLIIGASLAMYVVAQADKKQSEKENFKKKVAV